jgi:F-box protein 9
MMSICMHVRMHACMYACLYACLLTCTFLFYYYSQIPVGAILETVYYRYLYFQEDGRVLYALSSTPPHVMFKRLLKVCLHKTEDPTVVWGTFQIQKNACTVTARQSWHDVQFALTIQANSTYGRFGTLVLDRHLSSTSGNFEERSSDLVEYKVPTEQFQFVKDARL